ncbi:hypothetical protein [Glycomyces tenuis]|uniref:hypothetical protein n=1 Tax=Glycomyces tenuis TaxID=58116 RepID=UPI0003FD4BEC|nr:hypothetical protein [Glycomyces tenuis]
MSELRKSVRALGIDDPEAAISVHALLGSDASLLAHAGELPRTRNDVPDWVKSTFLNADNPLFGLAEHAVSTRLGEEPDEGVDKVLSLLNVRPRAIDDLTAMSSLAEIELEPMLTRLAEAGIIRADPDPLRPDHPFWTVDDRFVRFHYAMLAENLDRWRRGRITDKLWSMTHARFDRYVCRPEFTRLAREWALGDPAAAQVTRIVVPDPRHRQLRTLEVAAWDGSGELLALGTVRWAFRMRHRQLQRLKYVRRLLGDPPVRLYCIAPRVDAEIAADTEPGLFRIGPAHLLRGD